METSGDTVDPTTKRANLKLFIGLIVFALALAALCVVWMHYHAERVFHDQMQSPSSFLLRVSERFASMTTVQPTAGQEETTA